MTQSVLATQSAYVADVEEFSGERLIGWYARPWPAGGRSAAVLIPRQGATELATVGSGAVRAMAMVGGTLYVAVDGRLKTVSAAGVVNDLGAIADDRLTTFAWGGTYLGVCAAGQFWSYNVSSGTLAAQSIGSLSAGGVPICTVFLDAFAIVADSASDRVAWSGVNDWTSWDGTHFASAEALPDDIQRIIAANGELWIFGEYSTEIWGNTGAGGAGQFARLGGGRVEKGCYGANTPVVLDNSVFWVGHDRRVYRASSYVPVRVSSYALERILEGVTAPADLIGLGWREGGHEFYGLRFPNGATWALDLSTGLWSEISGSTGYTPWSATATADGYGAQLVGTADGKVKKLSPTALCDCGAGILREAVSPPVINGNRFFSVPSVAVDIQTGSVDGEPQVAMQFSRDGGRTWGRERWRSLGKRGDYRKRIEWHALGETRDGRIRLRITDRARPAIYGVTYEAG